MLHPKNTLDKQNVRKEYSTTMSEEHVNQRKIPAGSLYRRPSQVDSSLRVLARRKKGQTQTPSPFQIVGYSIACERHPLRNEDSFLIEKSSGIMAVFDGVGGSAAGEIASQTASRAARERWREAQHQLNKKRHAPHLLENCQDLDFCMLLQQLIEHADDEVRTEGAQQAGTTDLATTVAIAALCRHDDEISMFYGHVGDSRVYLLPEQGFLRRLTTDDGLLGRLVENQMVTDEDSRRIDQAMYANDLSDLEFSYFRLRGGITQALGGPLRPTVHIDHVPIGIGDRVLLCTDGIHDNLTDKEIESILRQTPRNLAARYLVEHSLLRSRQERHATIRAKPDDMSAIVMTRIH